MLPIGDTGCCAIATLLLALAALAAQAQSYSIDWYSIAGGGGTSTGGPYQVNGTIGQHDAGKAMSGGNYSVIGDFLHLPEPANWNQVGPGLRVAGDHLRFHQGRGNRIRRDACLGGQGGVRVRQTDGSGLGGGVVRPDDAAGLRGHTRPVDSLPPEQPKSPEPQADFDPRDYLLNGPGGQ